MYISFLRSINVGGKNKINMTDLSEQFTKLGYLNVKTYLNTGNIIFDSKTKDSSKLELEIKDMILENWDYNIEVIIRTKKDLENILNNYKFESTDGKNRYVTLLKENTLVNIDDDINKYKKDDDEFEVLEKDVYLYIPSGYAQTKITNSFIEKKIKTNATTRNINTIEKILILMK